MEHHIALYSLRYLNDFDECEIDERDVTSALNLINELKKPSIYAFRFFDASNKGITNVSGMFYFGIEVNAEHIRDRIKKAKSAPKIRKLETLLLSVEGSKLN